MLSCDRHATAAASDEITLDAIACIRAALTEDLAALGVLLDGQCHACLTVRTAGIAALFIAAVADRLGTTPAGWLAAVTDGVLQLLATGPDESGG